MFCKWLTPVTRFGSLFLQKLHEVLVFSLYSGNARCKHQKFQQGIQNICVARYKKFQFFHPVNYGPSFMWSSGF